MLIEDIMFNEAFQEALKDFGTPIPNLFDVAIPSGPPSDGFYGINPKVCSPRPYY